MPLANTWAFPSRKLSFDATLNAMKTLAERISKLTGSYKEYGHPIDLTWALEPKYLKAADEISHAQKLVEPIPKLCTLVTASAFDAALHDAFGKLHGLNCYHTYGPEFMTYDLSYYVGSADHENYKGEYPNKYIRQEPKARMPLYHLVSAMDPLVDSDITAPRQRWPAGDASRVDQLQRTDPPENQVGRRRPEMGLGAGVGRRPGHHGNPAETRRHGVGLLARLQRTVPECPVPGGFPAYGEGEIAGRIRADPVRGTAHGARP